MTRESPWDDTERERAIAAWEYDQELCPRCGNLREVCSNPEQDWHPQRLVCYASAMQAVAQRRYAAKLDGKPKAEIDAIRMNEADATTIWVASVDLNPDDDFLAIQG